MNWKFWVPVIIAAACGYFAGKTDERENSQRMIGNFYFALSQDCRASIGPNIEMLEKAINERRTRHGLEELEFQK